MPKEVAASAGQEHWALVLASNLTDGAVIKRVLAFSNTIRLLPYAQEAGSHERRRSILGRSRAARRGASPMLLCLIELDLDIAAQE
jgi:hypothetical protein